MTELEVGYPITFCNKVGGICASVGWWDAIVSVYNIYVNNCHLFVVDKGGNSGSSLFSLIVIGY